MSSSIESRVIEIISNVINVSNIDKNSTFYFYNEWDSLAYLSIAVKIEELFNIEINENNIDNFGSVKQIVEMIKKCQNQ